MQHILQIVVAYVTTHQEALLALVGGAGGLSMAIQWFLHRFKINGPVVSFAVSHVFALATAAAAYILDSVHPNAGVTYGWIWFIAQFWHRLVVNPAYNHYVLPFLDWLAKQKVAKATDGMAPVGPTRTATEALVAESDSAFQ